MKKPLEPGEGWSRGARADDACGAVSRRAEELLRGSSARSSA